MKKLLLGCLLLLTLVQACRKDNDTTQNGPIPTENVKSSLTGQVIDENGNPVAGALVLLENGNGQMTDAKGMFFYHDQLLNKNGAYIKVEKAGYFTSARFSFQQLNGASMMEVQLIPKKLAGTFDAASGGQFSFDNGAEVTIPTSGLVTASGATYSGTVKAYAVWLDPSQQRTFDQMPGDLRAIDANGNGKILTTYGMIGVELEGGAGEKLQIAPNQKAKIALTVPSSLQNTAPATIPLWHFDESNGYWKEEGSATLNNGRYEGEVSHFSFWNCCSYTNMTILTGSVVDNAGNPLSNLKIRLLRTNLLYGDKTFATGITSNAGYFGGIILADETFTILILDQCDQTLYTSQIGPFTTEVTLAPIVLSSANIVTVSGTLNDCSGSPLPYGLVSIQSVSGTSNNVLCTNISDSDGTFSFNFLNCESLPMISVTAYSGTQAFQSIPQNVVINNNTASVGPLFLCAALDEYVQLNLDGKVIMYLTTPHYEATTYNNGDFFGYFSAASTNSISLYLNFTEIINGLSTVYTLSGSYIDPALPIPVNYGCDYCATCDCAPADDQTVIFTNIPTAPGEYAIGSATGSVMVNGILKPYTMQFRIKQ